jgi:hypothetical protein
VSGYRRDVGVGSICLVLVAATLGVGATAEVTLAQDSGATPPQEGCSAVGCISGISLIVRRVPRGAHRLTLCVLGRCDAMPANKNWFASVKVPCAKKRRRVRVSVGVADAAGFLMARVTRRVRTQVVQPNAPCGPTCYERTVRLNGLKLVALR